MVGLAGANLATTGVVNASTQLANFTSPLKVLFFDFDKTLVVGSSDVLLSACDPTGNCQNYTPPVACTCNGTNVYGDFLVANASSRVLAEGDVLFNGTDRRDRIAQTFALAKSLGIELKVVSTSWYHISAANWAYFISKTFDIANLTQYIPLSSILALDDPGENIPADKGALIATYLSGKNWSAHDGLFVDDSPGNILSANGKVDWLAVTPRTGLAVPQLQYIDARANQSFGTPTGAPTPAGNTTTPSSASSLGAFVALLVPLLVALVQ